MKKTRFFFWLTLFTICFHHLMAQENSDTVLVRITTVDGNEYLGNIVSEDLDKVVFKTQNIGQITLDVRDIRSRERVYKSQIKEGKLWFVNPQASRYFWSPNGYGLRKGEGYYHNIWVLWNQFAYGLTNNFSIGGGIIPTFLFAGAPTPVFITPKFSIPLVKEKFNLGGGAILGTILGESESGFGIVYGLTTYGSRDNNMTLGVGYGFAGGEWAQRPLINLNGMARLSNRMYFLSENYYMRVDDENLMIFSLGGRWIIKKAAVDFGLFIPAGSEVDEFVALPWLGFTIPFGKK